MGACVQKYSREKTKIFRDSQHYLKRGSAMKVGGKGAEGGDIWVVSVERGALKNWQGGRCQRGNKKWGEKFKGWCREK